MIPFSFKNQLSNPPEYSQNEEIELLKWSIKNKRFVKKENQKNIFIKDEHINFVNKILSTSIDSKDHFLPISLHLETCFPIFTLVTFTLALFLIAGLLYFSLENIDKLEELFYYSLSTFLILLLIFGILALLFVKFDERSLKIRENKFNVVLERLNLSHFYARGMKWKSGKYGAFLIIKKFDIEFCKLVGKKLIISENSLENTVEKSQKKIYNLMEKGVILN